MNAKDLLENKGVPSGYEIPDETETCMDCGFPMYLKSDSINEFGCLRCGDIET